MMRRLQRFAAYVKKWIKLPATLASLDEDIQKLEATFLAMVDIVEELNANVKDSSELTRVVASKLDIVISESGATEMLTQIVAGRDPSLGPIGR